MENRDSHTIAVALSYAIAAVEKLPIEWQQQDELAAMRELFDRMVPAGFRETFMEASEQALVGSEKRFTRAKLV